MSETAPKAYSLKRKSEIITIEDEQGQPQQYTMIELTGSQRDHYLNMQSKKMDVKGKDSTRVKDFTGMCSDLLSLCLLAPDGRPIPAKAINEWPGAMQMELYKMATEMSGLKDKEEDAKND